MRSTSQQHSLVEDQYVMLQVYQEVLGGMCLILNPTGIYNSWER
jgi:hypothetical protein